MLHSDEQNCYGRLRGWVPVNLLVIFSRRPGKGVSNHALSMQCRIPYVAVLGGYGGWCMFKGRPVDKQKQGRQVDTVGLDLELSRIGCGPLRGRKKHAASHVIARCQSRAYSSSIGALDLLRSCFLPVDNIGELYCIPAALQVFEKQPRILPHKHTGAR